MACTKLFRRRTNAPAPAEYHHFGSPLPLRRYSLPDLAYKGNREISRCLGDKKRLGVGNRIGNRRRARLLHCYGPIGAVGSC